MIRILHVITDLDTGGAEVMLAKLVAGMDRARFTNSVVSLTDRGKLGESIQSSGVPVHCLNMRRGWPDPRALVRMVRLLKDFQPTLVQSWLYHADLLSMIAAWIAGPVPLVWNLRCSDMDLEHYPCQTRLVQRVLSFCSHVPVAVVVNSLAGQQHHQRRGYRPRRWEVIPNGFDTDLFRPDRSMGPKLREELGLTEDTVLLALVARVDPMKDHATFLAAAREVATAKAHAHFVLAGKNTETLVPRVAELGLSGRVHFLGPHRHIDRLIPGVDIVCLTSAFGEGFPNILGEAMAAGVPCITTDVGDARMIVAHTGAVVPPRDSQSLAAAMIDLIDRGPKARYELGQVARARVENEYSLGHITTRYETLYENLLSGEAGQSADCS